MTTMTQPQQVLTQRSQIEELADYRREVAEIYRQLRRVDLTLEEKWTEFRRQRDVLFAAHPQSALSETQKATFKGLPYYPYDPAWRFVVPVDTAVEPDIIEIILEHDGLMQIQRFGKVRLNVNGQTVSLSLFWILGYGGGIFLPFRDLTNGQTTYGGGRYLLDTIKQADLGHEDDGIVIDFNFAYNPSCAYNSRWFCPLAPVENRLPVAIPAGERDYLD